MTTAKKCVTTVSASRLAICVMVLRTVHLGQMKVTLQPDVQVMRGGFRHNAPPRVSTSFIFYWKMIANLRFKRVGIQRQENLDLALQSFHKH